MPSGKIKRGPQADPAGRGFTEASRTGTGPVGRQNLRVLPDQHCSKRKQGERLDPREAGPPQEWFTWGGQGWHSTDCGAQPTSQHTQKAVPER